MKQFWETINEFSGTEKKKTRFPIKYFLRVLDCAGDTIRGVADTFNKYYSVVGCTPARELLPPIGPPVFGDSLYRVETSFSRSPRTTLWKCEVVRLRVLITFLHRP